MLLLQNAYPTKTLPKHSHHDCLKMTFPHLVLYTNITVCSDNIHNATLHYVTFAIFTVGQ